MTTQSISEILALYNDRAPLSEASTIPAPWYVDPRVAELESDNARVHVPRSGNG